MNTRTASTTLLALLLLPSLSCHSFADFERKEKVVALVSRVVAPQEGIADAVTVWMIINHPSRFSGRHIFLTTESTDRGKIRADFPLGSLQILELPTTTIKALEDEVELNLWIEGILDTGMHPLAISQHISVPSVKLSELTRRPIEYAVNKEAEQAGTGQPATRPELGSEGSQKPQPESEGRSR